jgi:hypothetical protein
MKADEILHWDNFTVSACRCSTFGGRTAILHYHIEAVETNPKTSLPSLVVLCTTFDIKYAEVLTQALVSLRQEAKHAGEPSNSAAKCG